jgi:parvulin-like peptidyl-prolyl isomerase
MLQTMRRNMKVILWVTVISFILLIFLVWGADLQFGSGPQPNTVGLVNGDPVSTSLYQQLLAYNRQSAQALGRDLQPNDELQLEEQTWNTIVNEMLLRQEAERRGLGARDAEVRSILLNNPPPEITQDPNFRTAAGQFDLASYRALIQDPNTPESFLLSLEALVRSNLPVQKLQDLILSAAKVTEEELRERYLEENEKVRITYVLSDAFKIQVDREVTEEEQSAYYDAHLEEYSLPPRADILYVTVPRVPTTADSASLVQELAEYADDARKAGLSKAAGEENLDVSDFATLAQTFSDAPSADDGGLSAGYLTPAELSAPFADALANLEPGEISEPFQEGRYYHIVQLVDVQLSEDGERTVQIRDLAKEIVVSDSTRFVEVSRLEQVRQAAQTTGLRDAATTEGLTVNEARDIISTGIVTGLAAIPQVGAWAHENQPGTVSRVYTSNTAWHLLEVAAHNTEGYDDLNAVRNRIQTEIIRDRRFEAARGAIDRVQGRIKLGESLESAAQAETLTVVDASDCSRLVGVTGLGKDFEVLGSAFALPIGTISEPIESLRGWAIIRVEERPEVDWQEFEAQRLDRYRQLLSSKESRLFNSFLNDLRRKAEIDDYRI